MATGGGIYRGTSARTGLTLLTPVEGRVVTRDQAQMAAYQAYLNHPKDCALCPERTSQCDEAARLWSEYGRARA